jgi:hypothetical protein
VQDAAPCYAGDGPDCCGVRVREQYVLGPLCAGCLGLVAERVAEWVEAYPLATAGAKPWAEVAVLRAGRWEAR